MGLLTGVFIATDKELSSLRPGMGGPASRFPTVQAKQLDPVKLATLEASVPHRPDSTSVADVESGLRMDWGEEFVYRVPQSLASALTELEPGEIACCAAAWAETEEWRRDAPAATRGQDLARLLGDLCLLARRARHEDKAMYVWMSL